MSEKTPLSRGEFALSKWTGDSGIIPQYVKDNIGPEMDLYHRDQPILHTTLPAIRSRIHGTGSDTGFLSPGDAQRRTFAAPEEFSLAYGYAFAPNPDRHPPYFDYPYTEMGGQLADTGTIVVGGERYAVADVRKIGDAFLHIVEENVYTLYETALAEQYRFLSFGDAMLLQHHV